MSTDELHERIYAPYVWVLAAQDCQLVAEDQDLHLFASADRQHSTINSSTRRSAR